MIYGGVKKGNTGRGNTKEKAEKKHKQKHDLKNNIKSSPKKVTKRGTNRLFGAVLLLTHM